MRSVWIPVSIAYQPLVSPTLFVEPEDAAPRPSRVTHSKDTGLDWSKSVINNNIKGNHSELDGGHIAN